MRPGLRATVMLVLTLAVTLPAATATAEKRVTILYTANTSGKLTVCGCPGDPYGGLAERATLIGRLREKESPFLLLDAGNMVSLFGDYEARGACVMKLMNLMGYDAVAAGPQELFRNTASALAIAKAAKFPLLSASVVKKPARTPVFAPRIEKTTGGVRVGITAVSDSNAFIPDINREFDYDVIPIANAMKSALGGMNEAADFVVVLSQMDTVANKKLLEENPSVDLVVEGHGNKNLDRPLASGRGFIVAPGARGQFLGIVTLSREGSGPARVARSELIEVLDIPTDKKAEEIVREYYRNVK